ncbi:MAG: UDP-glucose 4-epimerase GalE [Sphingobacteriales bacterium]|nr:UDP-glucose 4-epimerase GalE [Sphingobacteriales bacterium]
MSHKSKILVTGGCGYIGAHTIVDLIENGYDVISVDNLSRATTQLLAGIADITSVQVKNYAIDLCIAKDIATLFAQHPDISGIIHFAAYKSVPESVAQPLSYYHNNLASLINLLQMVQQYEVPYFVFSSSCSVYGNTQQLPVTEDTPLPRAESPYGNTKQIGEEIIRDFSHTHSGSRHALLRYFNPVGAHPTALIGEIQPIPQNLVPYITQTAIGKRPQLTVFGNDYDTRDGICLRDYIHVCDIAHAHTLALRYLAQSTADNRCEVFNLGSGTGNTVLEAIAAFERVAQMPLPYVIGARREGDAAAVYADNQKARALLGWQPRYDLDDMMRTAWIWEQRNTQ